MDEDIRLVEKPLCCVGNGLLERGTGKQEKDSRALEIEICHSISPV